MNYEHLYLREACAKDIDILFEWANEEEVRKNAFNSHKITYEEHEKWFDKIINDKENKQYILMAEDEPVGQVRLTFDGEIVEVHYSIAKNKRGNGFGKKILKLVSEEVKHNYGDYKKIIGRVKPGNIKSKNCFMDNGFEMTYVQFEKNIEEV